MRWALLAVFLLACSNTKAAPASPNPEVARINRLTDCAGLVDLSDHYLNSIEHRSPGDPTRDTYFTYTTAIALRMQELHCSEFRN